MSSPKVNEEIVPLLEDLAVIGRLFQYPRRSFSQLQELNSLFLSSRARRLLRERSESIVEAFSCLSLAQIEESYTRAFDLAPLAAPYLSAYIYGDENFDRGSFLAALTERFRVAGYEFGQELPDHLAVVLIGLRFLELDEVRDLIDFLILPAVREINQRLDSSEGPYKHLTAYLLQLIDFDQFEQFPGV